MKKILLLSLVLLALGCASTGPTETPKPSQEQGGVPPNCWPHYHPENQGSGIVCTPDH